MARPQPGIFAQGTRSHYHLEFDLRPGATDEAVVQALHGLREPPVTAGGSNIVVGFGADLWRRLHPDDAPAELAPFAAIEGDGRGAPATQHDLWVWTHGTGEDVELDVARAVAAGLAPVATLAAEQPCFVYRDSRDLTGFIDGTENPPVEEAFEVALVPDGETGAGGAFVLAQKWVHDLDRFHAQKREEQEDTIGRTKPDSVELDDKPPTAHIAARRHQGGRRGARAVPAQHAVRAGGGARPVLPGLQRRPVALHQDAAPDVRGERRRPARPPDRLHPAGERRVLLRALARRARRHPALRLTDACTVVDGVPGSALVPT